MYCVCLAVHVRCAPPLAPVSTHRGQRCQAAAGAAVDFVLSLSFISSWTDPMRCLSLERCNKHEFQLLVWLAGFSGECEIAAGSGLTVQEEGQAENLLMLLGIFQAFELMVTGGKPCIGTGLKKIPQTKQLNKKTTKNQNKKTPNNQEKQKINSKLPCLYQVFS